MSNENTTGAVSQTHKIATPPQPAGFYLLSDCFSFGVTKKPNWIHRKAIEWILGWKWEDAGGLIQRPKEKNT